MRLTRYTDYALRVLMHLALNDDRVCSIGEIARAYDISHNHLMKVSNALAHEGFVETVRGRAGGMRLARPAGEISVGEVVRKTEDNFQLADCGGCAICGPCGLKGVLAQGVAAMLAVFDKAMISDLLLDRAAMARLIRQEPVFSLGA
jgi:Rrf2 family nitric oxide-sensitive transcriptional repressor